MSQSYTCAKFMFEKNQYFSARQLAEELNIDVLEATQIIHRIKKSDWYRVQTKKIKGVLHTKVICVKDLTRPTEFDPLVRLALFGER